MDDLSILYFASSNENKFIEIEKILSKSEKENENPINGNSHGQNMQKKNIYTLCIKGGYLIQHADIACPTFQPFNR